MLFELADLPGGGWKLLDERAWRMGAWGFTASKEGRRAHKDGTFSPISFLPNRRVLGGCGHKFCLRPRHRMLDQHYPISEVAWSPTLGRRSV